MHKTTDGGKTFSIVRGAPGGDDYHSLWIAPTNSSRMILGTDQGATISPDGGATWTTWYNQPTAQVYHELLDIAAALIPLHYGMPFRQSLASGGASYFT